MNAVTNIMNRAGIECHLPVASATTTNGICANMTQAADNVATIGMITEQIAQQQQANSGPLVGPGAGSKAGGASFMRTALTAGALAIGMAVVPGVAAVAAVAASIGEAAHFGLKGNAGKGEMTFAGIDAASAFDKGVYVSAFDGQSSDVATGKPVASLATMGQAAAPAKGMRNFKEIVADEMRGADMDDIQAFLKKKADANIGVVQKSLYNLEKRGALDPNDPNAMALRENMDDVGKQVQALSTPKPLKALNVGMGAPSMG